MKFAFMALWAFLLALTGCSFGGSAEFGGKMAPSQDTGVEDTAPASDTASGEDTAVPEDTGTQADTSTSGDDTAFPADSAEDSGEPVDTAIGEDTAVEDTDIPADTATGDTDADDSGTTDSDTGTGTPAATDTDGDLVYDEADCAPIDPAIHPYATEVCGDGIDQNCDGLDEACPVEEDSGAADTGTDPTDTGADDTAAEDTGSTADTAVEDTGVADTGTEADTAVEPVVVDEDGDGIAVDADCNDTDASIHPYATEVCDSVDNNCDGDTDEGLTTHVYRDADGDGYGDELSGTDTCGIPAGYVETVYDCNDGDATINPDSTEVCDDGIDQDCDSADEACPVEETVVPYDGSCTEEDILFEDGVVYIGVDCMDSPWNEYDARIIADISPSGSYDYDPSDSADLAELTDDTTAWSFDFNGEAIGTYQFQLVSEWDSLGSAVGSDSSLWVWVRNNGICWDATAGSDADELCYMTGGPYDGNSDGTDDWADFMFRVIVNMDGTVEPAGDGA